MKTIVVPTDFSVNAENALTYACEINKKLGMKLVLLHSFHVPIPTSDIPAIPVSEKDMQEIAMAGLTRTREEYEMKYPGMQFELEASLGMASDEIINLAKTLNSELIIMGTHGSSGLKEFLLGSNTASVMERSSCAVLAVPDKAVFNGVKEIVFAADYGHHNYDHMIKLIELAKLFDSEIILLHISSGEIEDTFEDLEIGRFKERIVRDSGYTKISYRLMEDKDAFHGMNVYLDQNNPDILAISMHRRTLLQRIFSRSLAKRMAYHSHVPLLALHIGT